MKLACLALSLALAAGCTGATEPPHEKPPAIDVDRMPSWNPDGTRIVYKHGWDILRILDLTTGQTTDIGQGFEPKWSPDGRAIAYAGEDGIRKDHQELPEADSAAKGQPRQDRLVDVSRPHRLQ